MLCVWQRDRSRFGSRTEEWNSRKSCGLSRKSMSKRGRSEMMVNGNGNEMKIIFWLDLFSDKVVPDKPKMDNHHGGMQQQQQQPHQQQLHDNSMHHQLWEPEEWCLKSVKQKFATNLHWTTYRNLWNVKDSALMLKTLWNWSSYYFVSSYYLTYNKLVSDIRKFLVKPQKETRSSTLNYFFDVSNFSISENSYTMANQNAIIIF